MFPGCSFSAWEHLFVPLGSRIGAYAGPDRERTGKGAFRPTIAGLYEDEEILATNPFFGDLYETFVHAAPRPSTVTGTKYNQVSHQFWQAVHAALSGQVAVEQTIENLDQNLHRIRRSGW